MRSRGIQVKGLKSEGEGSEHSGCLLDTRDFYNVFFVVTLKSLNGRTPLLNSVSGENLRPRESERCLICEEEKRKEKEKNEDEKETRKSLCTQNDDHAPRLFRYVCRVVRET